MLNTLVFSLIQTSLENNIYYLSPQRSANLLEFFQDSDTVPTDTLLGIYRSFILAFITYDTAV